MKRPCVCLLLLTTVPTAYALTSGMLPAQDANEAEKLFREAEALLTKSKSVDTAFDVTIKGAIEGKFTGTLAFATGNKARLELDGEIVIGATGKQPFTMRMISDGVKTSMTASGPNAQPQLSDTEKDLGGMLQLFMARSGIACPIFLLAEAVQPGQKPKEFKAEEKLRVGDFRTGTVEKAGGRVVHHSLTNSNFKEPLAVTVWLDAKTGLPVKRVVSLKYEGRTVTVTEAYSKLTVDGKGDAMRFELPKQ